MPQGPCKTADQVCGYLQSNSIGYIPFLNPRMTATFTRSVPLILALHGYFPWCSRDARAWASRWNWIFQTVIVYHVATISIVELSSRKPRAGQRRESVALRNNLACTMSPRGSFESMEKTAENFERSKREHECVGILAVLSSPKCSAGDNSP
ncbi:hypothetical protein BKA81DRAFT_231542 [Phyllosticta paracitricarpa]